MDSEASRRACEAFRVKLRRDTGVNLTAAVCEELLAGAYTRSLFSSTCALSVGKGCIQGFNLFLDTV
jgi:hypothetical protein